VAGQAIGLAQRIELGAPAGEELVHVRLMSGVEQQHVTGGGEHPVRGDGQLDDTQVRSQMPAEARTLSIKNARISPARAVSVEMGSLLRSAGLAMRLSRLMMAAPQGAA
jgi:hypothetical protein